MAFTPHPNGATHATTLCAELRIGAVAVEMDIPELGFAIDIGEIHERMRTVKSASPARRRSRRSSYAGYGLVLHDRAQGDLYGAGLTAPAGRLEGVGEDNLGRHAAQETRNSCVNQPQDNIQATGFFWSISKLPHYVDSKSELELIRKLRRDAQAGSQAGGQAEGEAPSGGSFKKAK